VTYGKSPALHRWLIDRKARIETLRAAHGNTAGISGPGRPADLGRPVAHAYVLTVVAEFQGFVRDLHDLGALSLIGATGVAPRFQPLLMAAATEGRGVDRGNARVETIQADFRRLGLIGMNGGIGKLQPTWTVTDRKEFEALLELRNSLAHGNAADVSRLRGQGVQDTVSWTRQRLPMLNRTARSMDRVVWDHFTQATGAEPWERR
jgi:hypothetical protein